MTPSSFDIKVIQKQATPPPVGPVLGTGTGATRAEFFINITTTAAEYAQPAGHGQVVQVSPQR